MKENIEDIIILRSVKHINGDTVILYINKKEKNGLKRIKFKEDL